MLAPDCYWFERHAPWGTSVFNIYFEVATPALPLTFEFNVLADHPCGIIVRRREYGNDFSRRLRRVFLRQAIDHYEAHLASTALELFEARHGKR